VNGRMDAITATTEQSREQMREVAQTLAGLQTWMTNLAATTVETLEPMALEELAGRIREAENAVLQISAKETRTRHASSFLGAMEHAQAQRSLSEAQDRLAVLRIAWKNQVEPWIRLRALVGTNFQSLPSRQDNPGAAAAAVNR